MSSKVKVTGNEGKMKMGMSGFTLTYKPHGSEPEPKVKINDIEAKLKDLLTIKVRTSSAPAALSQMRPQVSC